MVQRLICCLSCLSLSVTVAIGSDQPSDVAPPAPPTVTSQPSAETPVLLPLVDASLSPVDHLRRAADHLEAAAVGELADDMKEEAKRLREMADGVEQEVSSRLTELREQLAEVRNEIRQLERFTGSHERVQLDVKVVEIDVDEAKRLGVEIDQFSSFIQELLLPQEGYVTSLTGVTSTSASRCGTVREEEITVLLDRLISNKAAKIISEPRLITTSGQGASILIGGEFPILMPQQLGTVSIEWREYGVRTTAVPVVLNDGRLRLQCVYQLSHRNYKDGVTIEGMVVPDITTRRIKTDVEMEFGQTAVIGGLTSTESAAELTDTHPILNKIPYPQRLFKQVTASDDSNMKNLVVLVTPRRYEPAQD